MFVVLLKNGIETVQRYFYHVQRFNTYRQLGMNETTLRLIRRDLGIADPTEEETSLSPEVAELAGGSHAAVRSGNGAPRSRHFAIRLDRAGSGA